MKKLLLATVVIMAGATAAQAEINVDIGLGAPAYPVYVEPQPVYGVPYVERHPDYYHNWGRGHHHEFDRGDWGRDHHEDRHEDRHDDRAWHR